MNTKTHVKPGDKVTVISGGHKGKTGEVTKVDKKKDQVVVAGVRRIKKCVRRSEEHPEGGIIEMDGPIHISNVKKIS